MTNTETKSRGILFSPPMVKAILAGRKTVTRREVKPQPFQSEHVPGEWLRARGRGKYDTNTRRVDTHRRADDALLDSQTYQIPVEEWLLERCPYGNVGDELWVRETFWKPPVITPRMLRDGADTWPAYAYNADGDGDIWKQLGWRKMSSIHMPRAATRAVLEVTDRRVERLQNITEADCIAEGMNGTYLSPDGFDRSNGKGLTVKGQFAALWQTINGFESWARNPFVWVISFKVVPLSAS